MNRYRPPTPAIRTVHDACLAFLRSSLEAFELFASGFEGGDAGTLAAGRAKLDEAERHFEAWRAGVTSLLATGAGPVATAGSP